LSAKLVQTVTTAPDNIQPWAQCVDRLSVPLCAMVK